MAPMTSTCKYSLQQLLKLLLLLSNKSSEVFPHNTRFQASGESSNEDTECVTGQLLLVSLYYGVREPDMKCKLRKNPDLLGSPDRGCGLTMDSLYDTELCSATTPTAKCRLGPRGLQSTLTPKEFLWERMTM